MSARPELNAITAIILTVAFVDASCAGTSDPHDVVDVEYWRVNRTRTVAATKCPFEWQSKATWCSRPSSKEVNTHIKTNRFLFKKTGVSFYSINGGTRCREDTCLEWEASPLQFAPSNNVVAYIRESPFDFYIATTRSRERIYLIKSVDGSSNLSNCYIPTSIWKSVKQQKLCYSIFGKLLRLPKLGYLRARGGCLQYSLNGCQKSHRESAHSIRRIRRASHSSA